MVSGVETAEFRSVIALYDGIAGRQKIAYEELYAVVGTLEIGVKLLAVVVVMDVVLPYGAVVAVRNDGMQQHHGERQCAGNGYESAVTHLACKDKFYLMQSCCKKTGR